MVHVGVLGAGAVGAFFGGRILAGNEGEGAVEDLKVTLVGRSSLLKAVEEAGGMLTTATVHGETNVMRVGKDLVVTDKMEELSDCDIIIVAVKGGQTETVARELAAILRENPKPRTLVSLQNGVCNAQTLRDNIPLDGVSVLAGMLVFNIIWNDATFTQTSTGETFLQDGPHAALFARMCARGGVEVEVEEDITPRQYGKLLLNMSNAINALAGVPTLETLMNPEFRKVAVLSMNEALAVFDKAGISVQSPSKGGYIRLLPVIFALPQLVFKFVFPYILKINPTAKTSMLQDLERGRLTEIDLLNGEITRVAKAHGIDEPKVNTELIALVKAAEGNGSPHFAGEDLLHRVRGAQTKL
ncbi:Hypothetical Protein FCC1311_018842 [Hondaea fermentalgiana]|uniref:2-dehydropantoate 2-reductase n=1 Tax=Hondaea fermentalgiana TaxID=2315210 RepID=A0A2R5G540_9STRA|nr:Hypothetical Protein FCC1311_018842 [Hondaea fermentalgiana]|eukprot:GBG25665.1 Hypothetical Protein FCC1311_018842 [Hondaea fermentalgiana]